jgi:hypothetical protein
MKKYSEVELETKLNAIRDLIEEYLEWSNKSEFEFEQTRLDIARSGLREVSDELHYLICE